MRGLIIVLISNVCYLAEILIFLVVTARYQEVTAGYRSLLLVPPFSMNRVYRLISSIPSNINFHIYNFSKVIKLFASLYFFVLFGLVGKNVHIY